MNNLKCGSVVLETANGDRYTTVQELLSSSYIKGDVITIKLDFLNDENARMVYPVIQSRNFDFIVKKFDRFLDCMFSGER